MRNVTIGMLAHVDAGKTTLAESILYHAGHIRTLGRVDHGSSHLDVDAMERERGAVVLLEPWYAFRLEVPQETVGRAITDVQNRHGTFGAPLTCDDYVVLEGEAPVATMQEYAVELAAYTRGRGRLFCTLKGYAPCHNAEQVVAAAAYDPEADLANTPDSVFCAHGAGYAVKWHEAQGHMHLGCDVRATAFWRPADAAFFSAGA